MSWLIIKKSRNQHLKLIDFSLGGTGVEVGSILPPKKDSNDKIGKILKITEEENPVPGSSSVEESIIKNIKK